MNFFISLPLSFSVVSLLAIAYGLAACNGCSLIDLFIVPGPPVNGLVVTAALTCMIRQRGNPVALVCSRYRMVDAAGRWPLHQFQRKRTMSVYTACRTSQWKVETNTNCLKSTDG